ncbi:MAG: BrnT family toxin [Alphaproteobacteria bacterium]|nr:BrnT family toxin [Alphaproteobacteria bacterium]
MTIFEDSFSITVFDADHSDAEDRGSSIGESLDLHLVLAVHTGTEIDGDVILIRLISARRPTRREAQQYYEGA